MTILQAQKKYSHWLSQQPVYLPEAQAAATIDSPQLDSELLIAHLLKKPREFVIAHPEKKLTASQAKSLEKLIKKRGQGQPVAQLTGKKDFYGYTFKVNHSVLTPRPETEMLVEEALSIIEADPQASWKIVDVGTGSGAIIIALAKELEKRNPKHVQLFATEISQPALMVAKQNARSHKIQDKIKFLKGDLLKPLKKNKVNLIVANLPYLSFEEYYNSPFYQTLKWEPKIALTDEKDGLENFRKFFGQAPKYLKTGTIILEIGYDQADRIKKIAKCAYPQLRIQIKKDPCGFDRVAIVNI